MNINIHFFNSARRIALSSHVLLSLLAGIYESRSADPANGTVIERGPHHRVIKLQVPEEQPGLPPNSYTELCTGMHYWEDGQWKESSEEIEEYALGFVASKGQHKLVLSKNLKEKGSVDLLTPGEQRLRSTPMGLAYYEVSSGKSVLIAELKESEGAKYAPNQVIYRDAFTDIQADVRYIYTKAGFEQDVILRQQLPSPTEFGLDPNYTRIEVWTEFFETAKPEINPYKKNDKLIVDGHEVKLPDLMIKQSELQKVKEDKSVENRYLGGMLLDSGKAFMEEGDQLNRQIQKQWEQIEGRDFLVEGIAFESVKPWIDKLPQGKEFIKKEAKATRQIPDPTNQETGWINNTQPWLTVALSGNVSSINLAANTKFTKSKGLVLDYQIINGNKTNFVFSGRETYIITGPVNLYEQTTIEGGAVVKFPKIAQASINIYGSVICATQPYLPAILTTGDDATVGKGGYSTDLPGVYYAWRALYLGPGTHELKHLRIRCATNAIYCNNADVTLSHVQIVNCGTGIYGENSTSRLRNVLFSVGDTAIAGNNHNTSGEHLTIDQYSWIGKSTYPGTGSISLTNCVLTQLGANWFYQVGQTNLDTCIYQSNGTSVYQQVGAGYYYLSEGSVYRNAGNPAINRRLQTELCERTTYPPIFMSNAITSDLILSARPIRDTDRPDLGFHYATIDYAAVDVPVSGATLILTNGVAVMPYANKNGFWLENHSRLMSEGRPDRMNHFIRHKCIQEQPLIFDQLWNVTNALYRISASEDVNVDLRFTDGYMTYVDGYHIYGDANGTNIKTSVRDCQWFVGQVRFMNYTTGVVVGYTNNFHLTSEVHLRYNVGSVTLVNNTFTDSWCHIKGGTGDPITLYNNLFDRGYINTYEHTNIIHHHNAYCNIGGQRLQPPQSTDVILSSFYYEPGPYGDYYQPYFMQCCGANTKSELGLYNHTTQPHQPIEGNAQADIGFHYVTTKGSSFNAWCFADFQNSSGWYYLHAPWKGFTDYRNTNNYLPTYGQYLWWNVWGGLPDPDYYCMQAYIWQNPGNSRDSVTAYVVPRAGRVRIRDTTYSFDGSWPPADGIQYRIYKNNELPELKGWQYIPNCQYGGQPMAPVFLDTHVQAGDALYFQINAVGQCGADTTFFLIHVSYLDPLDTDNDGLPDYMEDRNGNGQYDSTLGETNWQVADNPLGDSGTSGSLNVFTPLKN